MVNYGFQKGINYSLDLVNGYSIEGTFQGFLEEKRAYIVLSAARKNGISSGRTFHSSNYERFTARVDLEHIVSFTETSEVDDVLFEKDEEEESEE
jgi:hypothetical protein